MEYQCPYTENTYVSKSKHNISFQQALLMEDTEFRKWASNFRNAIRFAWDNVGVPPINALPEDEIVKQFRQLLDYDVGPFLETDLLTYSEDVIANRTTVGTSCNQFFPTMLKTRDAVNNNIVGNSVYDYFSSSSLKEKFVTELQKYFNTDRMYLYSIGVEKGKAAHGIAAQSGKEWIQKFGDRRRKFENYDFWLEPKRATKRRRKKGDLTISGREVITLQKTGTLKEHQMRLVSTSCEQENDRYRIRLYNSTQKVFPAAQRIFSVGFGLIAPTNFPPLTAKFVYRTFTDHIKNQDQIVVYDPSAGWGGRLLGALSLCKDRNIHYVGNDPNSDHWMDHMKTTKYEYLADYFNSVVRSPNNNTYEIFSTGSEIIDKERAFSTLPLRS